MAATFATLFGDVILALVIMTLNSMHAAPIRGYEIISSPVSTMVEAQTKCQNKFNTALATIATTQDLSALKMKLQSSNINIDDTVMWVGYIPGSRAPLLQWVSEQRCENNCATLDQIESEGIMMASSDAINQCNLSQAILCDANSSLNGYPIQGCTMLDGNCYKFAVSLNIQLSNPQTVGDIVFESDTFSPAVATWNDVHYLVGMQQIHSGDLKQTSVAWENYTYNHNPNAITKPLHICQSTQNVFVYSPYKDGSVIKYDLFRIDLTEMSTISTTLPIEATHRDYVDFCLVADESHVYVLGAGYMYIYAYFHDGLLSEFQFWRTVQIWSDEISACVMNKVQSHIYIFGSTSEILYKFDINNGGFVMVEEYNMCSHGIHTINGITLPNDKAYLHGCSVGGWQTLVFNMLSERFENLITHFNAITDIEFPKFLPYYKSGQLVELYPNIFLLVHMVDFRNSFRFYSAFTDAMVYDFEETDNATVWASDAFVVRYSIITQFLLDEVPGQVYSVFMQWSTDNTFMKNVTLFNASADSDMNCNYSELVIGNGYIYENCISELDLNLTLMDSTIEEITIYISSHNVTLSRTMLPNATEPITPLIVPRKFNIHLKRCEILFEIVTTENYKPFINISYELASDCLERNGTDFILDVTVASSAFVIKSEVSITISDDSTSVTKCTICDSSDVCSLCTKSHIVLEHPPIISSEDTSQTVVEHPINVTFASKMVDLITGPEPGLSTHLSTHFIEVATEEFFTKEKIIAISISSVVALICVGGIIILVCFYYRRNKILAKEVQIQRQHTHYITNPLVLCCGIAEYDDDAPNPGIDVFCKDLYGIDRDYENIKRFCKLLNYDFYPNEKEKYDWTQNEIEEFIKEHITRAENNMNTLENDVTNPKKETNGYDAILCVFSGHGFKNHIITNDYQLMHKTAIHRLFSTNHPRLRDIPRIFIFDCCDGAQDKSPYSNNKDRGKNLEVSDIEIKQDDNELWKSDQVNPDYKLLLIHGANEGFQAKMCSMDGSYLIYEFVKETMQNIDAEPDMFFGEIMDKIQEDLHKRGKQQITPSYNNHTRYIKFKPNLRNNPNSSGSTDIVYNEHNTDGEAVTLADNFSTHLSG